MFLLIPWMYNWERLIILFQDFPDQAIVYIHEKEIKMQHDLKYVNSFLYGIS